VLCFISSGNDNIHLLTNNGRRYKLRVDLGHFNGSTRYAEYDDFKIGDAWEKYKLVSLGAYSGTAGKFICLILFKLKFTFQFFVNRRNTLTYPTSDTDDPINTKICMVDYVGDTIKPYQNGIDRIQGGGSTQLCNI
jgi:hypothetical protein